MDKTLAMKTLEGKRVAYEVFSYPDTMRDAEEIATYLGLSTSEVFKTLVLLPPEGSRKPLLVMIPANSQLDLKKIAIALKAKKVKMATQREAEALTGLQVGGISTLTLLNRGFLVFLDHTASEQSHIFISGGKRGNQLKVPVRDLVEITRALVVDLIVEQG